MSGKKASWKPLERSSVKLLPHPDWTDAMMKMRCWVWFAELWALARAGWWTKIIEHVLKSYMAEEVMSSMTYRMEQFFSTIRVRLYYLYRRTSDKIKTLWWQLRSVKLLLLEWQLFDMTVKQWPLLFILRYICCTNTHLTNTLLLIKKPNSSETLEWNMNQFVLWWFLPFLTPGSGQGHNVAKMASSIYK